MPRPTARSISASAPSQSAPTASASQGSTKTLYEEKADIAFSVGVDRSTDNSLIFISTGNNSSNEVRIVPADNPTAAPALIRARKPDQQYEVDAAHGKLWILANDTHVNFRAA